MPHKRLIKEVEQFLMPLYKVGTRTYYGFSWDYNNRWINSIQRENRYDNPGKLISSTTSTWAWDQSQRNPFNGWWEKDSRYEFGYDDQGYGTSIHKYRWNSDSDSWENEERITFNYESSSSPTEGKAHIWAVNLSNHPNPFNAGTELTFKLVTSGEVSLKVYDLRGKLIRTLLSSKNLPADEYRYRWDGKDQNGSVAPSGIYLYRLESGNRQISGKCLLVK